MAFFFCSAVDDFEEGGDGPLAFDVQLTGTFLVTALLGLATA